MSIERLADAIVPPALPRKWAPLGTGSPLEHIQAMALRHRVQLLTLCRYDITPGEYSSDQEPFTIRTEDVLDQFEVEKIRAQREEMELGICSKFIAANGEAGHWLFGDMLNNYPPPIASNGLVFPARSSEKGWHFYTDQVDNDFSRMMGRLLLIKGIDHRWAGACLIRGFAILRLTANGERFKGYVPKFVEPTVAERKDADKIPQPWHKRPFEEQKEEVKKDISTLTTLAQEHVREVLYGMDGTQVVRPPK